MEQDDWHDDDFFSNPILVVILTALAVLAFKFRCDHQRLVRQLTKTGLTIAVIGISSFVPIRIAAGPSYEDMEYNISRPLTVKTTVKGDYRFDIILPAKPNFDVPDGQNSSWYGDEMLVVRKVDTSEIIYSRSLMSENVRIVTDGLAEEFIIMREWSGGMSCCLWITSFRTAPKFEVILRHNNDHFDSTQIVAGPGLLELHRNPTMQMGGSAHPEYRPRLFDLGLGSWR